MLAACIFLCVVGFGAAFKLPAHPKNGVLHVDTDGAQAKQAPLLVPLTLVNVGSNNEAYRVNVGIGTPAQNLRLTLDNSGLYDSIHVLSSNLKLNPNATCKSVDINRTHFDPTKSSTYVEDDEWEGEAGGEPYYPYEGPKCTKDAFGFSAVGFNDTLQIGSVSLPSVPANLIASVQAPLNPEWVADGFFNIYPAAFKDESSYDSIGVALQQFQKPVITLFYARKDYYDPGTHGALTWGGVDSNNCDSKWTTSKGFALWRLMVETFSINGKSSRVWNYVEIDVSYSIITAPQDAVDAIVKATDAEYDFKSDMYQVDCGKVNSFPDLVFKLPGLEYHLPAVDYARRLAASDNRCTLMISADPYKGFGSYWILGTTFFRPYCTLADYSTGTFSLAKALH